MNTNDTTIESPFIGLNELLVSPSPVKKPEQETKKVKAPQKPPKNQDSLESSDQDRTHKETEEKKTTSQEVSEEVKKFTSKLVNIPSDPSVNKVGFYFTRREIDQLNVLMTKLKPILRDQFNLKVTKNDVIRACLTIGLTDWEENQLTSKLVNLLTSK